VFFRQVPYHRFLPLVKYLVQRYRFSARFMDLLGHKGVKEYPWPQTAPESN